MLHDAFVTTSLGHIQGHNIEAQNRFKVQEFLGIPYAKPPTGENRLLKPRPVEPWEGVLEASEYSNIAVELPWLVGEYPAIEKTGLTENENCLYLNIWKRSSNQSKLPVFVFFGPGAFHVGTGNSKFSHLGDFAAGVDCIAVSLNYRLAALGFWYVPEVNEPNLGLYDQQMALKWVHEHIASFGGDPDNITICGDSAGSCSVGWHYLNLESNKYFSKAIMMSGGVTAFWGMGKDPNYLIQESKKLLADEGGNVSTSAAEQLKFMQSLPVETFQKGQGLASPFGPIWEDGDSLETLLQKLNEAGVPKKPLLSTIANHEGDIFMHWALIGNDEALQERLAAKTFERLTPNVLQAFQAVVPVEVITETCEFYKEQYKNDEHVPVFKAEIACHGDFVIVKDHMIFIRALAEIRPGTPIYFAVNDMKGTISTGTGIGPDLPNFLRSTHLMDVAYLFNHFNERTEENEAIVEKLQTIFKSFIYEGKPGYKEWDVFSAERRNYVMMSQNKEKQIPSRDYFLKDFSLMAYI